MKKGGRLSANVKDRRGLDTGPGFETRDNPFGDATFNPRGVFGKSFTGAKVLRYSDPEAEHNADVARQLKNYANSKRRGNPTTPQVPKPRMRPSKNPFQIL